MKEGLNRALTGSLLRKMALYAPALVLPRASSLALMLGLTHVISPSEFGYYTLVVLVGELADAVFLNPNRIAQMRLDSAVSRSRSAHSQAGLLFALGFVLALLGTTLLSVPLANQHGTDFAAAVAVYVISNGLLRNELTLLRMQGRARLYALIECSRALLSATAGFGAALLWKPSYFAASLGASLITLAYAAYARHLRESTSSTDPVATRLDRLKLIAPLTLLALVAYAVTSSDRFSLQLLGGPEKVGIYAAALAFGRQPLDLIANAINTAAFPELVRRHDLSGPGAGSKMLQHLGVALALCLIPTCTILVAASHLIVRTFLPVNYHDTAPMILSLIAVSAMIMNFKNFVFDQIFHLYRRNWLQIATYAPAGATTVALCMLLVPSMGATGAALAALAGALAGLLMSVACGVNYIRLGRAYSAP